MEYPEKDLTEKIIGCAFNIFKELGYGLPERMYHKAMETALKKSDLNYKRECYGKVEYDHCVIGKYFLDFLVEDKVALEFKVRNEIYQKDLAQLLNYLKMKKLKVGLLLVITSSGVEVKRVVN